jgi:hypothetical protein
VGMKVLLAHDGDDWGSQVLDPLRRCVNVDDYCDPSSIGILTCVKTIEMCVETTFATVCMQSAIADRFLLFWWGRLGRVVLHKSPDQRILITN